MNRRRFALLFACLILLLVGIFIGSTLSKYTVLPGSEGLYYRSDEFYGHRWMYIRVVDDGFDLAISNEKLSVANYRNAVAGLGPLPFDECSAGKTSLFACTGKIIFVNPQEWKRVTFY